MRANDPFILPQGDLYIEELVAQRIPHQVGPRFKTELLVNLAAVRLYGFDRKKYLL